MNLYSTFLLINLFPRSPYCNLYPAQLGCASLCLPDFLPPSWYSSKMDLGKRHFRISYVEHTKEECRKGIRIKDETPKPEKK